MPQIASQHETLISDEYRRMQEQLHENPAYGLASTLYAPLVADILSATEYTEVLDYGAGKGRLGPSISERVKRPLRIRHYDPAIPQWSAAPAPCEFVACIDVLEHVEPHLIDNVLDDLRRVTIGIGVFTVHTEAAAKVLPDGRNAHLIQQPPQWWLPKILERFELMTFNRLPMGFWIGVEPRKR
jgi:hypothetical protein